MCTCWCDVWCVVNSRSVGASNDLGPASSVCVCVCGCACASVSVCVSVCVFVFTFVLVWARTNSLTHTHLTRSRPSSSNPSAQPHRGRAAGARTHGLPHDREHAARRHQSARGRRSAGERQGESVQPVLLFRGAVLRCLCSVLIACSLCLCVCVGGWVGGWWVSVGTYCLREQAGSARPQAAAAFVCLSVRPSVCPARSVACVLMLDDDLAQPRARHGCVLCCLGPIMRVRPVSVTSCCGGWIRFSLSLFCDHMTI